MMGSRVSLLLFCLLCASCAPCGAISAVLWPGLGKGSTLVAKGAKGTQEKGKAGQGCCGGLESVVERMKMKAKAKRQQAETYFQEKGIDLVEIPKAIIMYEITSAGFMFGVWGLCYLSQPTRRGLIIANIAKPGTYEAAMAKGQKMSNIKGGAKRLATSYAESAVIRTAIKPVIIPAKFFITWKLQQAYNVVTGRKWGNKNAAAKGKK